MSASILRHRHRKAFTVLPNSTLRDPALSFRALGLLAHLVSLPEGSSVDSSSLAEARKEGRDAVRTAFAELVAAGYSTRRKEQDPTSGRWFTVVEISDSPTPGNPSSVPTPEKPTVGKPGALGKEPLESTPPPPAERGARTSATNPRAKGTNPRGRKEPKPEERGQRMYDREFNTDCPRCNGTLVIDGLQCPDCVPNGNWKAAS